MHLNLKSDMVFVPVLAATAAGQTTLNTSVLDMQGYNSVAFITHLGDVTDTSVITVTLQNGDEDDASDAADTVCAATFTADATSADNKLMMIDAHLPRKRYVRATVARATANAAISGVIAVLYNVAEKPVTLDDDMIAAVHTNDPEFA